MATIDILIPCYRYGRYLRDCVESIRQQSLADWRVLIVDDASPDGSGDVARALAASDPRIDALVHDVNIGAIGTYNEGVEWATAPYFMVLSADDRLLPGAFERAVRLMDASPDVVLTYGAYSLMDADGVVSSPAANGPDRWRIRSGEAFIEELCGLGKNPIASPSVIVRTAVQKAAGGYEATLPHACDMEMWMRFAAHGDVADTTALQAAYRLHGANMSSEYVGRITADYEQRRLAFEFFFDRQGERLDAPRRLRSLALNRLGEAAYWTGVAQMCRGRVATGWAMLRFAVGLRPSMGLLPPLGGLFRSGRPNRKAVDILVDLWSRKRSEALPVA